MGQKLLLIDDDNNLLELLQKIFERAGYKVMKARNATEALKHLQSDRPDLIILDLVLPDIDGYALLEKIKANKEWAFIPVVILSSRRNLEDKLRGLRLGVMDYLTKPFEREELEARVRNILDFYQMKTRQRETPAKSNQQRLIDFMQSRGIKSLLPRVSREAKLGYEYPEAAQIFHPEEPGGEIFLLESMAKAKMLDRVFYDAVHICPQCGHHDLNFREVCPYCEYADINTKGLLTHLGCGRRGHEDEFRDGDALRCPECGDALHAAGEDYTMSASSLHFCAGCKEQFAEPIVNCRCMNCDQLFDVSEALVRKVYAYRLISDWEDEMLDAPSTSSPGEKEQILGKMSDLQLQTVDSDEFARQLERQIRRAEQEKSGVSLVGLQIKKIGASATEDAEDFATCLDSIIALCKSVLRKYDVITLKTPFEWLIMLPETPFRMAKILAERLTTALSRLEFDIRFELNMASYPEDGARGRELLEVLNLGIVNLQELQS